MYKKIAFAVVIIAFASAQIVNSLICYECNGNAECKHQVKCSQASANHTNFLLSQSHNNVPNTTSGNFDCVYLNYTRNNVVSLVQGCVYREHKACDYESKFSSFTATCLTCSGNLCNTRNPAGTYSSSFYSLLGSALMFLVAKFFVL